MVSDGPLRPSGPLHPKADQQQDRRRDQEADRPRPSPLLKVAFSQSMKNKLERDERQGRD